MRKITRSTVAKYYKKRLPTLGNFNNLLNKKLDKRTIATKPAVYSHLSQMYGVAWRKNVSTAANNCPTFKQHPADERP